MQAQSTDMQVDGVLRDRICDGGGTLEPCEKGRMGLETGKWAAGVWENLRQARFQDPFLAPDSGCLLYTSPSPRDSTSS
eukprot:12082026-Prorocentrum_lima.AAC.1